MTDSHGNNLMLAFIDYHYQIYSNCGWPNQEPLEKKDITQFLDYNFDINFQNTKTGDTFLIKIAKCPSKYVSEATLEWIISTYKPDLNLQNNSGITALATIRYNNYNLMALLLKYGAHTLMFNNNGNHILHCAATKKSAQLLFMFSTHSIRYNTTDNDIHVFWNDAKNYDILITSHLPIEKDLDTLIKTTNEGSVLFQRAAICNDTQILDYFLKNTHNQQYMLLKIIKLCCWWNRAGATQYALSRLNPNRNIILNIILQETGKNVPSILQNILEFFYEYGKFLISTENPLIENDSNESKIPELERELTTIYNHARKDPKTGFKAWLFLEAFDKYLMYGNQKENVDAFINFKKNYDCNFIFR